MRSTQVVRPNGGRQAVRVVVRSLDHLVLLVERGHAHHRAENLLFHETRRVLQVRDHRRQDVVTVRIALSRLLAFEFSAKLNK